MKKWWLAVAAVIIVGVIGVAIASKQDDGAQTTTNAVSLAVGTQAPDFSLSLSDKKQLSLAESKNKKPLIILGTFADCGEAEALALMELKQEYGDKVQIVAMDILEGEPVSALERVYKDAGVDIPIAAYDKQTANDYKLTHPDTTFIIDKQGVITYHDKTITSYEQYKRELEKVL